MIKTLEQQRRYLAQLLEAIQRTTEQAGPSIQAWADRTRAQHRVEAYVENPANGA